eukprot:PITA_17439
MRPQLPVQPNPNPNNNKASQVIDIQSQPALPMQCNDIHLCSGRVVEPIIDDITDSKKEETRKEKSSNKDTKILESPTNKTVQTTEPPFPERLTLSKTFEPPAFNLLGELQNFYVKNPLLQALRDVPIYARTVRDICVRKLGRKAKEPLRVHVMAELTAPMIEKDPPVKYGDPGHPTVIVQVGKTFVSKVLVDLGAAINIMTLETTQLLQLKHLIRETPTILELADRSKIKPEGVIEELVISIESWNYPADFVVLQTKTMLGGHPLILGRPWLATTDAFISYRSGSMTISNGQETKQLTLYPHATPMINNDHSIWVDYEDEETQPILTIGQALTLKNSAEDELISNFISEPSSVSSEIHNHLTTILESKSQKNLETKNSSQILAGSPSKSVTIEIEPGKTLNINPNLTDDQKQQLMKLLKENKEAFVWDYTDVKGISPELCTHRIYIKEGSRPVCQPQRKMNPNLREIVKEELQKLLNAGFIYPISDSEWVSPLVIVPKKNGKWRVCVDYRALNKATQKDHFPLPFIDQEFDITIVDRPGKENVVADFLSRLKTNENIPVDDSFPMSINGSLCPLTLRPKALIKANEEAVLTFLFEEIFVRFGLPRELVIDGGPPFNSHGFKDTLQKYHIKHKMTTPYHPQANGQVESTNKVIEAILTKTIKENRRDWFQRLPEALWAYRTTWRNTTGFSPYELVFGKNAIFPVEFEIKTLRTAFAVNLDLTDAQTARLQQLQELDEKILEVVHQTMMIQQQRRRWHDRTIKQKQFQKGNWALLYDSLFENFQGKLRTRWLGPYEVDAVFPNGTVRLLTIDGSRTPLLVNGYRLRLYQRSVSKEDFKATCMAIKQYSFPGELATPQST